MLETESFSVSQKILGMWSSRYFGGGSKLTLVGDEK